MREGVGEGARSEDVIAHSNDVFAIEKRGFDHIPEAERNMQLRHVDYLWVGTSVNMLSFALGALGVTMGLNLWWALAASVVGNMTYAYMAYGSIITVRAGLPVSTLARASFGRRGNLPNAALVWVASVAFEVINTIFGVEATLALFGLLGWTDPGNAGKLIAVAIQLFLSGGIAVLGHATMIWFQRVFSAAVGIVLLVVMFVSAGNVDWSHAADTHAALDGTTVLAAFMTAIGAVASNAMSFLFNGADWVRYLPSKTPSRSIFLHVFWSSFLPSLMLTMMGAWCATMGDVSDPVAGLKPLLPHGLFMVYVLAVLFGSLANSVPTYYSSGLSLQAMGLRLHRYAATMVDLIAATAITLYILFVQDFSTALNDFVALMVVWVGPFGGVWIADGVLRRAEYDFREIHSSKGRGSRYWGWHGFSPPGYIAIFAGMVIAFLSMRSPLFDGPLARALGGTDLSWLLGFPVSMVVYLALSRRCETVSSNGRVEGHVPPTTDVHRLSLPEQ